MAGIQVGSVSVAVVPSARTFAPELRAVLLPEADKLGRDIGERIRIGIDTSLKGLSFTIDPNLGRARAEIDALKAEIDGIRGKTVDINIRTTGAAGAGAAARAAGAGGGGGSSGSSGGGGIVSWIPALVAGATAIAPAFVIAGAGISAFGALAGPELAKVTAYEHAVSTGASTAAAKYAALSGTQRQMVLSLHSLGTEFHAVQAQVSPVLLDAFDAALVQAKEILVIIAPVAKAGGQALAGLITQVGGAFTDSGGREFFTFVEHNLGPDTQAISTLIVQLIHLVFNLAISLQPVSLGLIRVIGFIVTFISWLSRASPPLTAVIVLTIALYKPLKALGELEVGAKILGWVTALKAFSATALISAGIGTGFAVAADGATVALTGATIGTRAWTVAIAALDAVNPLVWIGAAAAALGLFVYAVAKAKNSTQDFIAEQQQQDKATGFNIAGYAKLSSALHDTSTNYGLLAKNVRLGRGNIGGVTDEVNALSAAARANDARLANLTGNLNILQRQYGLTQAQAISFAQKAGVSARSLEGNGAAANAAWLKLNAYGAAESSVTGVTNGLAFAVTNLTAAMQKNVVQVLTLQGDDVAWRQAQQAATAQLASNTAGLAGNSANALANKAAVLSSTNAVVSFADNQLTLHGNLRLASAEILSQISYLQKHGDHSKFAAAEIAALWTEENKLKAFIGTDIRVKGTGQWTVTGGTGTFQAPGGGKHAVAARGLFIRSGQPGVDDQIIAAQLGELVVPANMVRAGAVDHLKGSIPGFDKGGVVGNYSGTVSGLSPWLATQTTATLVALENAVAHAVLAGIKSMSGGFGMATGSPSAIVRYGESFLGTPYVWGGTTPAGWDCSGFSSFVYHHFGIPAPRTSQQQQMWAQPSGDRPGALVFFYGTGGTAKHVGISTGAGMMVNAANPALGTLMSSTAGNSGFGVPPGPGAGVNVGPRIFDTGNGWLPSGGWGYNGTNRPEAVFNQDQLGMLAAAADGTAAGTSGIERRLDALHRTVARAPAATAAHLAEALDGAAHVSAHHARYG